MSAHVDTVVIEAGQAGLTVSRELGVYCVEHVVLEQSRVAQAWRDRWDSFTSVTPVREGSLCRWLDQCRLR